MLTMLREGRRPESILVSDPRTEAFLSGFCQEQQISLRNGEMPDMIDSLVNRNRYLRDFNGEYLPDESMQALDFFLFAPDEAMPTEREELDTAYSVFSFLDQPFMSDPLRKNVEKILRRIENLQNKKRLTISLMSHPRASSSAYPWDLAAIAISRFLPMPCSHSCPRQSWTLLNLRFLISMHFT